MSATGAGMLRKQSSQRPCRSFPTLFLFFSDRESKHRHCGHTSSSEISRILSDDSLRGLVSPRGFAGFLCSAEFPSNRWRLGSAACDPGTMWRVIAFNWIIMIQKAGVKNASILGLGSGRSRGDIAEELA